MQFDYDYFLEQGRDGVEAFVRYLADTYELDLAPHVQELVIGSIVAGSSYKDYAGNDALSALGALVAVRDEAVVAVAVQVRLCRVGHAESWEKIARQLGVTRQAAEQRYRQFTAEAETPEQATLEAAFELCDARIRFINAQVAMLKAEHGTDAAIPDNLRDGQRAAMAEFLSLERQKQALIDRRSR